MSTPLQTKTSAQISFNVTAAERKTIKAIVARVRRTYLKRCALELQRPASEIQMDLTATHANGCPLRLHDLLNADDFNLLHDVFGIERHLNRETGQLEGMYRPRFSAAQVPAC